MPKVEVINGINLEIDLSDLDEEVRDYVTSQLPDRLDDRDIVLDVIDNIELDIKDGIVTVTSFILEMIQKTIEEKQHDIEHERKHGERD